ncbi:unnamed protein product, partial [Didymodactylos carnosus]
TELDEQSNLFQRNEKLLPSENICLSHGETTATLKNYLQKEKHRNVTLKMDREKKVPWKAKKPPAFKEDACEIRLLDFKLGDVRLTGSNLQLSDHVLPLGFASSALTRVLYYEAVQTNMLQEDAKLIDVLPEQSLHDVPLEVQRIAINDLACHSSGLPDYAKQNCKSPNDLLLALKTLDNLSTEKPSILAISLLGHALVALHDTSYDDLFQEKIAGPLELFNTCVNYGLETYYPACGIQSTLDDMSKLLMILYCNENHSCTTIIQALRKSFSDDIARFSERIQELTTDSAPVKPLNNIQNYTLDKTAGMPKVYESIREKSLEVLLQFISISKQQLLDELHQYGALLFCGFDVITAEHFSRVVESFTDSNKSFLDYRDGISPRTRLTTKVFISMEYPKHVNMSLHNEMSYSTNMPSIIFFFCEIPPVENTGQTPIGDSRAI